jgi:hypothetical protein
MIPVHCDGCKESRDALARVYLNGKLFFLCVDCCRKIEFIISGDVL